MAKFLIITADDLGISLATNRAIDRAHRKGLVTSASLMANMRAFDDAVERTVRPNPGLGVGVHLCLTSGRPVLAAADVPMLVDAEGRFRHGFFGLLRLIRSRQRREALEQIAGELRAQAERLAASGIRIDHVDSHRHVHLIPGILEVAREIAIEHRAALRIPSERFALTAQLLPLAPRRILSGGLLKRAVLARLARRRSRLGCEPMSADHYFGVLDSGRMTQSAWMSIARLIRAGVTEVNIHPSLAPLAGDAPDCCDADLRFLRSPLRAAELEAITDPLLREELARREISLVRFADVIARPLHAAAS